MQSYSYKCMEYFNKREIKLNLKGAFLYGLVIYKHLMTRHISFSSLTSVRLLRHLLDYMQSRFCSLLLPYQSWWLHVCPPYYSGSHLIYNLFVFVTIVILPLHCTTFFSYCNSGLYILLCCHGIFITTCLSSISFWIIFTNK